MHDEVEKARILVLVLHAAKLANSQTFAGSLQLFVAKVFIFSRLTAFGRGLVRAGHGTVARNIFFGFFVSLCRYRKSSFLRNKNKG